LLSLCEPLGRDTAGTTHVSAHRTGPAALRNLPPGLARKTPEGGLPMDVKTADAILEFGDDLRRARRKVGRWAGAERRARESQASRT
jgi:hypothetical protein